MIRIHSLLWGDNTYIFRIRYTRHINREWTNGHWFSHSGIRDKRCSMSIIIISQCQYINWDYRSANEKNMNYQWWKYMKKATGGINRPKCGSWKQSNHPKRWNIRGGSGLNSKWVIWGVTIRKWQDISQYKNIPHTKMQNNIPREKVWRWYHIPKLLGHDMSYIDRNWWNWTDNWHHHGSAIQLKVCFK